MCLCQVFLITSLVSLGCSFTNVRPLNSSLLQMRVAADVNDVQLLQLLPNTAYSISLFALHGEASSEPLIDRGVTRMLVFSLFVKMFSTCYCQCVVYVFRNIKLSASIPLLVPLPPAGELRITEVTHSSMRLTWDAAPGNVRKYIITYKREDGDLKEVIKMCSSHSRDCQKQRLSMSLTPV